MLSNPFYTAEENGLVVVSHETNEKLICLGLVKIKDKVK